MAVIRPHRRVPRSIKVMGKRIKVMLVQGLMIHSHHVGGDVGASEPIELDLFGLWDDAAFTIALDTTQGDERMKVTFLHEAMHALLYEMGPRDLVDFDQEERLVRRLTPILLLFLKENPAVYTYLTGRFTFR